MKKLTAISILLVLLSVTAFAQLKVGFTSNLWTDAVFFQTATGDLADKDNVKGVFDVFADSRFKGSELRLKFTYTGSHFEGVLELKGDGLVTRGQEFFAGTTTIGGAYAPGTIIYFWNADGTSYDDPANPGTQYTEVVGSSSVSSWNNTSFARILSQNFGDYYVKGTAGIFTGYLGNTANRGRMNEYRFDDFTDFIADKLVNYGAIKLGSFSPLTSLQTTTTNVSPGAALYSARGFKGMVGSLTDTDNLKGSGVWDNPYASFTLDFGSLSIPISIDIATVLAETGYESGSPVQSPEGAGGYGPDQGRSRSAIAGSFRVSGGKFADLISFDAIYKIRGKDPDTSYNANALTDGAATTYGTWNNELGAYVGVDLFSGFKLGAGYTAAFAVVEDRRLNGNVRDGGIVTKVDPVFNGIDLRLKLTMIPSLAISLNNNLSFAWQRGENDINTETGGRWIQPMGYTIPAYGYANATITGIPAFATAFATELDNGATGSGVTGNMKNTDQTDNWLALWNSLGVSYDINERVKVSLAISNRLGVYDFVAKPGDYFAKWTTDDFQAAVAGFYNFSSNVSFAAGLHLGIWGMQTDITIDKELTTGKIGEVTFAIPIQFKVTW